MKFAIENKLIFLFAIISTGLITLGILAWQNNKGDKEYSRLVFQTHDVLLQTEKAKSIIKEFEIGNRGYAITGDSVFLSRYNQSKNELAISLANLKVLTQDNISQQSRIDSLILQTAKKLAFSDRVIEERNLAGEKAAENMIATREGEIYMDQIREIINEIEKEEQNLLIQRNIAKNESEAAFFQNFYMLFVLAFAIVFMAFLIIIRNFRYRIKSERELFIKNEWYNQTLISLGDGVITTDHNGLITYLNKAARDLTGWKEEEAKGVHVEDVFDIKNERTGQKVVSPVIEAMKENKIMLLSNHTVLKRKDNSELFIDDSGAPIHNPSGEIIGGVLIFRDITEKKIAEDKIVAAEKRFSTIFNISPVGIAISSFDDGVYLHVNDAYCQLVDLACEAIIGKKSIELNVIDAEDRQKLVHQIGISNGRVREIEIRIQNVHGKKIDVLCSMEKIEMDNQMCLVTYVVDISKRKKAEQQIRILNETLEKRVVEKTREIIGQEQYFKNMLDNLQEGLQILDKDFTYTYLNDTAVKQSRFSKSELLGHSILENYPGIESTDFFKTLHVCMKEGKVEHIENEFMFPDQSTAWFELIIQPVEKGVLILSMDISKRKNAEKLLENQNQELIKKTTELDRFVYSASHDLRAPLTSLLGLIDITQESLLAEQEEQKEWLTMMRKSVHKLDDFIKEILHYSRNSHFGIEKEEINFKEIIDGITENLKYFNDPTKYQMNVSVHQEGEFISDKNRINLILNNLVSNGIKYQDPLKPLSFLHISVLSDDKQAIITVEDNGIGILKENQEKIFGMFYRATPLSKGSGLGLYILKETLEKLNGNISVDSEIHIGTKFSVRIPNLI